MAADARGFDFYKEKASVKNLDDAKVLSLLALLVQKYKNLRRRHCAKVAKWRKDNCLTVHNIEHKPILTFADAPMHDSLMACTKSFEKPSVIQSQCWPVLLAGRDIVGIASTGSGKTLAFGLPGPY